MPPRKRPKIDAVKLLGNRRLTQNHIFAVLEQSHPEVSRRLLRRSVEDAIEEVYTSDIALDLPLQLTKGRSFSWPVARPPALIRCLVPISPALRAAFALMPCSYDNPWHLVLYLDEITPGNISAPMNGRKFVAVYYTFKEFARLVRNEAFWFHFGFIRTSVMKKVLGGYGALTKSIVNTFINDVESFVHVGIAVDIDGPRLLYAKCWRLLADGAALAAVFDSNMSSGTKQCFACANAIKDGTFGKAPKGWVPITGTNMRKFIRHTNESVWKSIDDLNALAPGCGITRKRRLRQCYGFKDNPHGLLANKPLRKFIKPVDFLTNDWAHIFAQNGVGNIQLYHAMESIGIDVNALQDEVNTWALPALRQNLQGQIKHFFRAKQKRYQEKVLEV